MPGVRDIEHRVAKGSVLTPLTSSVSVGYREARENGALTKKIEGTAAHAEFGI